MRLGQVEGFLLSRKPAEREAKLGGQQNHRAGRGGGASWVRRAGFSWSGWDGVGLESQCQAGAPGSSSAGNQDPSKVAKQVWGTKAAPGSRGQTESGICKLLGLRTALLNAQANLKAQGHLEQGPRRGRA